MTGRAFLILLSAALFLGLPVRVRAQQDLTLAQRIRVQIMLAAGGYTNHVPTLRFDRSVFRAIEAFQTDNGFDPDGTLNGPQLAQLFAQGSSKLDFYGFRKVAFPGRRFVLWVPLGLGLTVAENDSGLTFNDTGGRLTLYMFSYSEPVDDLYKQVLAKDKVREHCKINFQIFNKAEDWFAISSSTPEGKDRYYRYHRDGGGVTGFTLEWDNSVENINAERIAVIMSGSLGAAILGTPFIDPPGPMGATVYDPAAELLQQKRDARAKAEEEARAKVEEVSRAKIELEAKAKADQAEIQARVDAEARAKVEEEARVRAEALARTRAEAEARAQAEDAARAKAYAEVRAKQLSAEQEASAAHAEKQAAMARLEAERAKADAEAERLKNVDTAKKAENILIDKAAQCARAKLPDLVKSGENAEVLTSVTMTMCSEDIDHVLDAGIDEFKLEHQESDSSDGVIRERIRAQVRDQITALSVQAKAGIGGFAPPRAN